jgi:phosphatidylglycerophosphate synthase
VDISGRWSTRANALSGIRLILAPLLVWALLGDAADLAGGIFAIALITDLADGWVARRFEESSALGGLIDHAADASFVALGCAALVWQGEYPWPLPGLIVIAFVEYAGSAWRSSTGTLRRSSLGRWNGIAYYVALGIPVVRDALQLAGPGPAWVRGLGWALVASTLLSIVERRWPEGRTR